MKNILLMALVVALAAVAWLIYSQFNTTPLPATQGPEWTPSASFGCEDSSHFIAEFPASDKVDIIVDGNVVRTLPRVAGAGQRFEDANSAYVFAGEEVSVTTKATGTTTTCHQPVDPNNAPMNFGDRGEGAGVGQDAAVTVRGNIIGTWQSVDDAKFTRVFKIDGTVTDLYGGKMTSSDTFQVFTKAAPLDVPFPLEDGAVYVQLAASANPADTLNFKVSKLTPEELELVYMDRGNVLRFTKVQ